MFSRFIVTFPFSVLQCMECVTSGMWCCSILHCSYCVILFRAMRDTTQLRSHTSFPVEFRVQSTPIQASHTRAQRGLPTSQIIRREKKCLRYVYSYIIIHVAYNWGYAQSRDDLTLGIPKNVCTILMCVCHMSSLN